MGSQVVAVVVMSAVLPKVVSMLLVGGLPIAVVRKMGWDTKEDFNASKKAQVALTCLNCFGAGVILTTCITHMLPEVNMFLQLNIEAGLVRNTGLPLAEIIVLCGFFMIYIVEELVHKIPSFGRKGTVKKEEGGNENAAFRSDEHSNEIKKTHSHDHDEFPVEILGAEKTFQANMRGFLVILALSLHAVFEGIAVGLSHSTTAVWYLFFAIAAHKYVISFCCGVQFVTSGVKTGLVIAYIAVFSLISPVGIGIGLGLTSTIASEAEAQTVTVTVLQGLATGTLLYVVFFEVLEKERQKKKNGLLQVIFVVLGFVVMVLVQLVSNEEEKLVTEGCHVLNIPANFTTPGMVVCEGDKATFYNTDL